MVRAGWAVTRSGVKAPASKRIGVRFFIVQCCQKKDMHPSWTGFLAEYSGKEVLTRSFLRALGKAAAKLPGLPGSSVRPVFEKPVQASGIFSFSPTTIRSPFRSLADSIAFTVVPYVLAIRVRVSPDLTT